MSVRGMAQTARLHAEMDSLKYSGPTSVLFLDFDGVLQTPALEHWVEMEHCDGLRALLEEQPSLALVVVSTHREGRSLADIRGMLPDGIAQRVIGATAVTPLGRAAGGRQAEIEAWLLRHPTVEYYAAVDDEPFLYAQGCPWLATTNRSLGWGEDTGLQLRRILGQDSDKAGPRSARFE